MLALSLLGLMTLASSTASATTVMRLNLSDLVSQSEQIVHGTVSRAEAVVQGRRVYTIVTITVIDRLKGAAAKEVTFTQLGGRTPRLATYVPGTPTFTAGEEVVVFLERPSAHGAPLVVTGLAQGKFKVVQQGRQRVVAPVASGGLVAPVKLKPGALRPVGPLKAGQTLQHVKPSPIHQRTTELDQFKRQVRQVITAQAKAAPTPTTTTSTTGSTGAADVKLADPTTGPTPTLKRAPTTTTKKAP